MTQIDDRRPIATELPITAPVVEKDVEASPTTDLSEVEDTNLAPAPGKTEAKDIQTAPWHSKRFYKVIGGTIVGAVTLTGAAFGIHAMTSNAPAPDDHRTNATDGPTPEPSTTAGPEKLAVANIEIKAGLSDQDFAKTLYDKDHFSAWAMVGADDQTNTDFIKYKLQPTSDGKQPPTSGFVKPLSVKEGEKFAEALYADPSAMPNQIKYHDDVNAADLENFLITYKSDNPADIQPYTHSYSVDLGSIVAKSPTTPQGRDLEITVVEHDNAALNRIGKDPAYANSYKVDGNTFVVDITTRVVNGVEKITAEEVVSGSK